MRTSVASLSTSTT